MRFKDLFSIIGPDMIGPSSSHTAGALRIGLIARHLFGEQPEQADVALYQSFADTGRGHGTDAAIAAGLLGWATDDSRIPQSLSLAEQHGLHIEFRKGRGMAPHPNTAQIRMSAKDRVMQITGTSIGGGNVEIVNVDGFDVRFSAAYPTMVIWHSDKVGLLAALTRWFSRYGINIGFMDVDRNRRSGDALTVIEADAVFPIELVEAVRRVKGVTRAVTFDLSDRTDSGNSDN
ncbi:L-serine ammonia-lyase, iron-sulfur-dependent subunit beta [Paenibacillus sp. NPDC056579]|uniref:L-serine ammonia-lyase, iron-sulfur-dependent subunit beta n=1 Tax=Paenibacillus sp. NPDC056579 TaxID=3345871 RepID=UPI0036938163